MFQTLMILLALAAPPGPGENGITVCVPAGHKDLVSAVREIAQVFHHQQGTRVDVVLDARRAEQRSADVYLAFVPNEKQRETVAGKNAKQVARRDRPAGRVLARLQSDTKAAREFWDFLSSLHAQAIWAKWNFHVPMHGDAEAYHKFVSTTLRSTYAATALRMLTETGIREGLCIDVGCGSGLLDIELAKRSRLRIVGLDIDPKMIEAAKATVRAAHLEDRITFVVGDVHQMPFADDSADLIVSRGALPFFQDKVKALREIWRVLKPSGVAFIGGRYLYTPRKYLLSGDELRRIVRQTGIPGAIVVERRGQWVKLVGPEATKKVASFRGGPAMLAHRVLIQSGVSEGDVLALGDRFPQVTQELARLSHFSVTELRLRRRAPGPRGTDKGKPSAADGHSEAAGVHEAKRVARIKQLSGSAESLPFPDQSFDLIISVGELPFWRDKAQVFREVHRVLRPGGYAFLGGRYRHMPSRLKVSSDQLRATLREAGLPNARVLEEMGQWVEIRKQ
ncbi:MAG: methyltransferase domain-containing protein [Planctomycetes bacterium]|nr:methyltransferase domain-containing protein [Planctomycetota bacterium]